MLRKCVYCGRAGMKCPKCFSGWCVKNGTQIYKGTKYQRYRCTQCKKTVRLKYEE